MKLFRSFIFLFVLALSSQLLGVVSNPYFEEAASQTDSAEPYIPRQSFAPIKVSSTQSGGISLLINKSQGVYQCVLKFLRPKANEGLEIAKTKTFSYCSDAAVVTTNKSNFFKNGASVNTYLITANYKLNKFQIYQLSVTNDGDLKTTLLKESSATVYNKPPPVTGFLGVNQVGSYVYAVADLEMDQAGFVFQRIENLSNKDVVIYLSVGYKGQAAPWKVKTSALGRGLFFENYASILTDKEFYALYSQVFYDSGSLTLLRAVKFIDEEIDTYTPIAIQTDPPALNSRANTIEGALVGNGLVSLYKNGLKQVFFYKVPLGNTTPASPLLEVSDVEAFDSQLFEGNLQSTYIQNQTQGKNCISTGYYVNSKDYTGKASTQLDNDSKAKFISNEAVGTKISVIDNESLNAGKGIVTWLQKAKTASGKDVSFLVYFFTKKRDGASLLQRETEVVYTTPIGVDSASYQLNDGETPALVVPESALSSNTEAKSLDVIALPAIDGDDVMYVIKLVTYLKDSKTYSSELLTTAIGDGLSDATRLIKLIDTYSPIQAKGAL